MSDNTEVEAAPATPEPAAPKQTSPATGSTPARHRKRRWRRRLWRVLVAAVVARLLLALLLQPIASFGAGFAGLSLSWRSASLSLLGLSLHVEDLIVRDANDDEVPPLLTAQTLTVDLSMRQLLSGNLAIVDVGLAGARITVHQGADGKLRLPAAWLEPAPVATTVEPEPPPTDEPLDFELPARIASTRLHDLQLDFVDFGTDPPTRYTGKLDLDVANVGFPDRRGSALLRLHAPWLCDELFIQLDGQAGARHAEASWRASIRGFRTAGWPIPAAVLDALEGAQVVDLALAGALLADVLPAAPRQPALQGNVSLRVALDGIERSSLGATFGPTDASAPGADDAATGAGLTTPFAVALHVDDIVDSLELRSGRLAMTDDRTGITADLVASDINCRRLHPLLKAAGLTLPEAGIGVAASLDAEFGSSLSLALDRLKVRGGDEELLDLTRVAVLDLRTNDDTLAIGAIEIIGPELPIRRTADGALVIAGLRAELAGGPATDDDQPTPPAGGTAAAAWPKLRLGSFQWSGARLSFTDETTTPPAVVKVDDLRVQADAITLGAEAPPGRVNVSIRIPAVIEQLALDVTLAPTDEALGTELDLRATGVTMTALAPWLDPLGVTPELGDGTFGLQAAADLRLQPDGITCTARVANLRLVDGDQTWLRLRRIDGEAIRIATGSGDVDAGKWTIAEPYLAVHRDDEAMHAFGMRIASPRRTTAPTDAEAGGVTETAAAKPRRRLPNTSEPLLHHGEVRLSEAMLAWTDSRHPDRTWSIGMDARIGENYGTGQPQPLQATVQLAGAIQALTIEGTLLSTATGAVVDGRLRASGIRGGEFATFLPDGISCTLADGSLGADFAATITRSDIVSIDAGVRELVLADRDIELAAIDDIGLSIPKLGADEVHVRDLHLKGVRALVALTPDALQLPGFAIETAPAPETPAPETPAPETPAPETPAPETPAPTAPGAAEDPQPTTTAKRARAAAPLVLPRLRIDAIAFGCDRLVVHDRRNGDAEPLVLQFGAALREPWLGDPTAETPTQMQWQLDARCDPLGAVVDGQLALTPFELSPTADLKLSLSGFDTTKIAAVAPALGEQLRGDATALEASFALTARLNLKRRDPSQFDFSRPFGGELVIEDFVLRDAATDRTFASVASIDAIARAIDPRSGSVLLRSLDIDDPVVRAWRDSDGLLAGGFRLPSPPATQGGSSRAEATRGARPSNAPARRAPADPAAVREANAAEIAIDRLRVLGVTIDYRDATTDPPTHLSFVDTDAELQRFSTRAVHEPRPMSFSVTARGGDIELEERVVSSSLVAGILGSAAEAVTGGKDEHELERRPMVDRIAVTGQLQLHPVLKGRVQTDVDGLELAAFRGLAKAGGVDLSDGLYDMRLLADLKGHDGIVIVSRHVLTWLALAEPPGGPISTYLQLPAPLQTVLFLLRNSEDEQRLPITVKVPASGLSAGAVADLAVESLTRIIASAVGSAGTRVASTLTNPIFGGTAPVPDLTASASFAAGSPLPASDDLAAVVRAAVDDPTLSIVLRHELGQGDLAHSRELANPPTAIVTATTARLGATRRGLIEQRQPIARDVVALYAAGKSQEARRRHAQLQRVDTHIGEVEAALREALGMLGTANPRAQRRRTRRTALELSEARLDAITAVLRARHPELTAGRFERRPGRGLPVAGLDDGGRVIAALRRRSASEIAAEELEEVERLSRKPGIPELSSRDWGAGPPPQLRQPPK